MSVANGKCYLIFHFEINKYLKQTNKQNNSNPRPTQPLSLQPIQLDSCVVLHSTSVSASLLSIHAPATLKLQEKLSEKLRCSTTESSFYRRKAHVANKAFSLLILLHHPCAICVWSFQWVKARKCQYSFCCCLILKMQTLVECYKISKDIRRSTSTHQPLTPRSKSLHNAASYTSLPNSRA